MQIPSLRAKLLRHWAARQINRSFLGMTGKRESADTEPGQWRWRKLFCSGTATRALCPRGGSAQTSCTFCLWSRCSMILELLLNWLWTHYPEHWRDSLARMCSLTKMFLLNKCSILKITPCVSEGNLFFKQLLFCCSRRISRFTISLSPSWGCFFSISVCMLPGWKMRNKYLQTPEQKKPWDGSSAQVQCLIVIAVRGAVLSGITSDALGGLSVTLWKAYLSECLDGTSSALQDVLFWIAEQPVPQYWVIV